MTGQEVIVRYLEDAEAAERNFEDTLLTFANTGEQNAVKSMFEAASRKAKTQHERLEARLRELGGSPSKAKPMSGECPAPSSSNGDFTHTGYLW